MGTVLHWPKHLWHGPSDHKEFYESDTCQACVLSFCKRCRAGEAELTTECPGIPSSGEHREEVVAGTLDFTLAKGWHTPKGYRHGK